jgi:hypothetical protein
MSEQRNGLTEAKPSVDEVLNDLVMAAHLHRVSPTSPSSRVPSDREARAFDFLALPRSHPEEIPWREAAWGSHKRSRYYGVLEDFVLSGMGGVTGWVTPRFSIQLVLGIPARALPLEPLAFSVSSLGCFGPRESLSQPFRWDYASTD